MVAVALSGRRDHKILRMGIGFLDIWHTQGIHHRPEALIQHFMQMSQKAESGHIGTSMHRILFRDSRRILVQRSHGCDGFCHGLFGSRSHPVCSVHDTDPELLGQDQHISCLAAVIFVDPVRMHNTVYGKSVLHILIVDGMTAAKYSSGLHHLFRTAPHDFTENIQILILRKTHNIQCTDDLTSHGIHITQRICCRNLAKHIGILQHRRKEIQRLHHSHLITDTIDCRIITAVKAHQQIRVGRTALNPA